MPTQRSYFSGKLFENQIIWYRFVGVAWFKPLAAVAGMSLFRTKFIEHSRSDADESGRGLKRSPMPRWGSCWRGPSDGT